jgi:hypothetical protein
MSIEETISRILLIWRMERTEEDIKKIILAADHEIRKPYSCLEALYI